jgi:hypothetical protein
MIGIGAGAVMLSTKWNGNGMLGILDGRKIHEHGSQIQILPEGNPEERKVQPSKK